MKKYLLWDLDGTLTNPRLGIVRCFQHALQATDRPIPDESDLLWVIGPPLQQSFAKLAPNASETEVWHLVAKFRERFAETGMFENEVYLGIPELLSSLQHKKKYIATSKPHVFANKILSHFELSQHFQKVYGSELDGTRSNKGELLEFILQSEGISPADALIVGDREHDVLGAKKAGITSVGITWGYGAREELTKAGADFIFDTTKELKAFLNQ